MNRHIENFVVAAYLAVLIERTTKEGRSPEDTVSFAVALYHGMVVKAQKAAHDEINWTSVEKELKKEYQDEVNYINEVVQ